MPHLGAKVLKRLLAEKKPEGSLCARVLKSSDGRQYNGKRDRQRGETSKTRQIKDQWISHKMENRKREQVRFGR